MAVQITVVTLNLQRTRAHWRQRRRLLLTELRSLVPDVVAFQEVDISRRQAHGIARELRRGTGRGYRTLVARKPGWRGLIEGVAIITRLPVVASSRVDLGNGRVAVEATVEAPGGTVVSFYSVHLSHGGSAGELRLGQARRLVADVEARAGRAVIAGDLNAGPESRTMALLGRSFRSAHVAARGCEPDSTLPGRSTGHVLDYILLSSGLEVVSCELAFAVPGAGGRYASDHYGLVARLRVDSA